MSGVSPEGAAQQGDDWSPSDAELILRVSGGDADALAEIHRRHAGPVGNSVRRLLFDWTLIDDVVQDVFTRLWRNPALFDPARGSLGAYLKMSANGRALDAVRSESSRRARERRFGSGGGPDADAAPTEAAAVSGSGGSDVYDAVMRLAPAERNAILLAFFGGRTYREVAVALGLPEGTAKSQIRAGLMHLRAALSRIHAGADDDSTW